ncbi:MAG: RNA 2',3'-cyclic phosphodiesterase [Deltaproteobacteria bacterium]|nr:RNA 2',3'-cyclic phosphodiesterase [Deltaproteobacteria bacterium]MCB9787439.1 RNA 2',3'-cyclic phosphodiesterase [Deltaproteobacteria bacterium]
MQLRLFVAIDLPETIRDDLAEIMLGVPGARWVDDDNLHVTLRFVGEVDGHAFEDVADALSTLRKPGFQLALTGTGHFPPRGQPTVLWAGVSPEPGLLALRGAVDRAVIRAGIEPEHRKYMPHVTLARLNGSPPGKVAQFLAHHSLFQTEPFQVDTFHLYSSVLRASGAEHTLEVSYPLLPPDPTPASGPE